MLKANDLTRITQKRTIRPLYGWHSAVPYSCFLDTTAVAKTTLVYPGMVACKTTGEQMDICNGTTPDVPFGLFNNFIHGDMDEIGGGTEIGVWVGGRDAVFEVLAGPTSTETPLDSTVTWTSLNATRGGVDLYATSGGLLTNATASTRFQVARLIEAVTNSKIVIQLVLSVIPKP
jgi:hypothetical protein